MTQKAIYNKLITFISTHTKSDCKDLNPETPLIKSGVVDSLLLAELIIYVEEMSGKEIDIDSFQADSFSSIRSIYDNYFIDDYLAEG